MVENLAQQTANQIVEKVISSNPNKIEDAFVTLSNKLYTDVYNSDPSPKAATKFIEDVFQDINSQFADGKAVPKELSLAWANQQMGHELPADGFSRDDLKKIVTSTEPTVSILDKAMANALIDQYSDLQHDVVNSATNRVFAAHECTDQKKVLADFLKGGGDPNPNGYGGYFIRLGQCDETITTDDREKMAGRVTQIPSITVLANLKGLDFRKPMELPF